MHNFYCEYDINEHAIQTCRAPQEYGWVVVVVVAMKSLFIGK